jgi:hypothetical protein
MNKRTRWEPNDNYTNQASHQSSNGQYQQRVDPQNNASQEIPPQGRPLRRHAGSGPASRGTFKPHAGTLRPSVVPSTSYDRSANQEANYSDASQSIQPQQSLRSSGTADVSRYRDLSGDPC